MPTVQSTFPTDFTEGYPGMVANGETSNRISRTIEDAAGIGFGKAAFRGAGDHGITATPSAAFMGITIADHGVPKFSGSQAADTFPQYHNVPLMQEGVIWVLAGENVADGDLLGVTAAGAFVKVANVGAGGFALPLWRADMTRASGTPVRITNKRAG